MWSNSAESAARRYAAGDEADEEEAEVAEKEAEEDEELEVGFGLSFSITAPTRDRMDDSEVNSG
jgi:hypothetical protein